MKKSLLAAALAAASITTHADTSIYGHVNYVFGDTDEFTGEEDITIKDNTASQSRFGFKSSIEANGITYATRQEMKNGDSGVGTRWSDISMSGDFGKISLGRGSEAGDDASEHDFSGTYILTNSNYEAWGLDSRFSNSDPGRSARLRYDTPSMGLLSGAVSINNADDVNVALTAKSDMWKAAAFYSDNDNESEEYGGSVAVNLSGFTAALHYAELDIDNSETETNGNEFTRVILGYVAGQHSVAVDYAMNEINNFDVDTVGLSYFYRPTKGVELYAGVRTADADSKIFDNNTDDSGSAVLVGSRVKF